MIEMRRAQLSFGDGLIAEEVSDLREGWMEHADRVLADEQIVAAVYEALARRHPKSRSRGRLGAPAEMVLRLLILKHIRNWSYDVLEREVRANLVYRDFTRVGAGKTPDAKTMGRWGAGGGARGGQADSPKACEAGSGQRVGGGAPNARGHHGGGDQRPLSDRFELVGRRRAGSDPHHEKDRQDRRRDWRQAVRPQSQREAAGPGHRPGGALQSQAEPGEAQSSLRQAAQCDQPGGGQAKRFSKEIARGTKRARNVLQQLVLEGLRQELDAMVPLVKQVMKQTRARIFRGDTHAEGKLLSLFEPSTEIIRKGKAGKPNEFGKMVKLQEAEDQIVIDYEVYDRRPSDSDLLIAAIETHRAMLGRPPHMVAADAAFYSAKNEAAAKAQGVKRVCIPNRSTKSPERKREQRKRWFRNGQKWRTGCEGRISVVKRRHGLDRCRYKGDAGMKRWVGLGVIADNVVNIGRTMEKRSVQ